MAITNLRRSPNAIFTPTFTLHMTTSGHELAELEARVKAFVRMHPLDWKPSTTMSIAYGDPDRIVVSFSVVHNASWSERAKIGSAFSEFQLRVIEILNDLGIGWTPPPAKVAPGNV